jgi:serine/threonine protein kinase
MKELIRQIVAGYKSVSLEGEDQGYIVFQGKEPDTRQVVDIKILPQILAQDPKLARRFEGLARTIRQLNHPSIAAVRKVGEEEGLPYLITRVLEKAQPLAAKLNQPWAVDAAADVVMQVGQAMEHAYNKGIVHGTLTPDNIAVADNGRVWVNDFGLTEVQELVGVQLKEASSPFLAPERRSGAKADARADVYSLAAVLYSMLANGPPELVDGEIVPPSQFREDLSPEMDAVVIKALSSNPEDRYPDVHSFLAAFGAVTLAPKVTRVEKTASGIRCSQCGADNQTGRFCRKCGGRMQRESKPASAPSMPEDILDEPILRTKIDVGSLGVGEGIQMTDVEIFRPTPVATGEVLNLFPEAPVVPRIEVKALQSVMGDRLVLAMPEPPSMPEIDWADIAPPMPEVPVFDDDATNAEGD